jgi:hypothetical protein
MGIPNQQIGWSEKSKLLGNISKQFENLIKVTSNARIPAPTNITSTWYLYNEYEPALGNGWITFPNHAQEAGSLDPNLVGQPCNPANCVQLYISVVDNEGVDHTDTFSQLVGTFSILVLSQGDNEVVYFCTDQAFVITGTGPAINLIADDIYGGSGSGALNIMGYASQQFNTTDPITIGVYPLGTTTTTSTTA